MQVPTFGKNWRKQVTVDPAAGIIFTLDRTENKPVAYLNIKNMSETPILYKIKTTMPVNYLVRPNQGVIHANSELPVKVIFNFAFDSPVSLLDKRLILFYSKRKRRSRMTSF
jgi:hypothetical protein